MLSKPRAWSIGALSIGTHPLTFCNYCIKGVANEQNLLNGTHNFALGLELGEPRWREPRAHTRERSVHGVGYLSSFVWCCVHRQQSVCDAGTKQ